MAGPGVQLFASREEIGGRLWMRLPPLSGDLLIVALSPGAVEVAAPIATLEPGELVHLAPAPEGARRLRGVRGRPVLLVDDGLHPVGLLVHALTCIRLGAPSRLLAAVPVVDLRGEAALRAEVAGLVVGLRIHRLAPGTEVYPDPPRPGAPSSSGRVASGRVGWSS